jgi:hypothetical protein
MAASHSNAAISDTFGDASDAVMPTSAFVISAASRTNALANEAKSASGTREIWRPKLLARSGLRVHRIHSSAWVQDQAHERERLTAAAHEATAKAEAA